jgi:hypothetical protein
VASGNNLTTGFRAGLNFERRCNLNIHHSLIWECVFRGAQPVTWEYFLWLLLDRMVWARWYIIELDLLWCFSRVNQTALLSKSLTLRTWEGMSRYLAWWSKHFSKQKLHSKSIGIKLWRNRLRTGFLQYIIKWTHVRMQRP